MTRVQYLEANTHITLELQQPRAIVEIDLPRPSNINFNLNINCSKYDNMCSIRGN